MRAKRMRTKELDFFFHLLEHLCAAVALRDRIFYLIYFKLRYDSQI